MTPSDPHHPFWPAARGEVPPPPCAVLLGWKVIEAEPDSGRAVVEFTLDDRFVSGVGDIQGGFVAAMLEYTMGPACATTFGPGEISATLELKTNFLRAAKPGRFVGTGRVVQRGKSIAFLEAELRNAGGELVATATSTGRLSQVDADRFWTEKATSST